MVGAHQSGHVDLERLNKDDTSLKCRHGTNNESTASPDNSNLAAALDNTKRSMTVIRYVEFFAGIGGWTMALQDATGHDKSFRLERCAALDHSDLCLSVYHHNHPDDNRKDMSDVALPVEKRNIVAKTRNHKLTRIEDLTVQQLVDWNADLWMMSPPCQPHTRQHKNQDADLEDSRSDSFLHLCDLLDQLDNTSKPSLIVLENVVGFERSNSCQKWETTLAQSNYTVARFHLQPTQVDIPNDRPRFYCVAIKRNKGLTNDSAAWLADYFDPLPNVDATPPSSRIHTAIPELNVHAEGFVQDDRMEPMLHFLSNDNTAISHLLVPDSVLERPASWCFDIVSPESKRSSCFTSAYGTYIKGTGSVLLHPKIPTDHQPRPREPTFALVSPGERPDERQYDPNWIKNVLTSGYTLRYFSGLELARLFGFPDTFSFPTNVTVKQQWKLIGNSLNVRVASKMVELGLRAIYSSNADDNKR